MLEDAELNSEEDKILDDEEINSCEGEDVEEHMLNVAIMKSVVDTLPPHSVTTEAGPESPRYGLRKRQRPGDAMDALEEAPKQTLTPLRTATIMNGRLSMIPAASGSGGGAAVPKLTQEPSIQGSKSGSRIASSRQRSVQPIAPNLSAENTPVDSSELMHPDGLLPASWTESKGRPQATRTKGSKGSGTSLGAMPCIIPTSGAVPNPLSRSTPPPNATRPSNADVRSSAQNIHQGSPSVPCPLPAAVPCPLPEQAAPESAQSDKRVTISDPPVPTSRSRIFSVDLDRKLTKECIVKSRRPGSQHVTSCTCLYSNLQLPRSISLTCRVTRKVTIWKTLRLPISLTISRLSNEIGPFPSSFLVSQVMISYRHPQLHQLPLCHFRNRRHLSNFIPEVDLEVIQSFSTRRVFKMEESTRKMRLSR